MSKYPRLYYTSIQHFLSIKSVGSKLSRVENRSEATKFTVNPKLDSINSTNKISYHPKAAKYLLHPKLDALQATKFTVSSKLSRQNYPAHRNIYTTDSRLTIYATPPQGEWFKINTLREKFIFHDVHLSPPFPI